MYNKGNRIRLIYRPPSCIAASRSSKLIRELRGSRQKLRQPDGPTLPTTLIHGMALSVDAQATSFHVGSTHAIMALSAPAREKSQCAIWTLFDVWHGLGNFTSKRFCDQDPGYISTPSSVILESRWEHRSRDIEHAYYYLRGKQCPAMHKLDYSVHQVMKLQQ